MFVRMWLALGLVVVLEGTSGADTCAPQAVLGGDAEAVAKVSVELKRLGVEAITDAERQPATACPVIIASVELDRGGGIAVAIRDAAQRSEGRVVSDAALAASWIDSWFHDDFSATPVDFTEPEVLVPPSLVQPAAPAVAQRVWDRVALSALLLGTWSSDRARWNGIAAAACTRTGGLCIGGRVGYVEGVEPVELTAAAKTDLSLLATASYAQSVGRMSIAPELGLGVGRSSTSRIEGCKPAVSPNCDPTSDPMCVAPDPGLDKCMDPAGTASSNAYVYVGDHFSTATYTPRFAAALRIAIPLFEHVWLDGLAAATAAPFSHGDSYATKSPDGTTTDPNTMSGLVLPLPGDATFTLELGIGIRVGAR